MLTRHGQKEGSAKTTLSSKKLAKPPCPAKPDPPIRRVKLGGKFLGFFREFFGKFREFSVIFSFNHDLQLDLA